MNRNPNTNASQHNASPHPGAHTPRPAQGREQSPDGGPCQGQPLPTNAIRLNLILPITRIGFGAFTVDPLIQLIGMPLADILSPLMTGPLHQRPSASGVLVDVYPLQLPAGEGASIQLGQAGELGFANDRGFLRLIVPWMAVSWIHARLAPYIVHGPVQSLSRDRRAYLGEVWIRLEPAMRAGIPLPGLGEVELEVR